MFLRKSGSSLIMADAWGRIFLKYLSDVQSFLNTGSMTAGKILSFHLDQVCCITKNKPEKKHQFGRAFQLARNKVIFLFAGKCELPNQSDKQSIKMMLETPAETFLYKNWTLLRLIKITILGEMKN